MKQTESALSRRTLLRGAGVALGLPWLEAMAPRVRAASLQAPPVRMAVLYMPNGVHPGQWTPEGEGRDFTLSPTLQPLAGFKDEIVVLTNLWNQATKGGEGHYVKVSGFLTCTTITKTQGADLNCNGTSMDQVAAQRLGNRTPLPSLELGCSPVSTGVDNNVGYTRVYGAHVAWAGPTSPLAREIDPRLVFERLFRAGDPKQSAGQRDRLLLDRVLDDARELKQRLGTTDRRRVDEYLSVVRSLEERIDRARTPERSAWKPRAAMDPQSKPAGIPKEHAEHVRLMMDMIALAFQTDTTRISTFMFGNEVSNINFSFLDNVKGGHHDLSHHQNNPEKLRQYQIVNQWHVEQYAYLLRRLNEIKEGDEPLLKNSMVLFGSGIRDGNQHDPHNAPVILAGRGGGRIDTGQHLVYEKDSQLANLYVSMLDAMGAPVDRFADSTGPLRGLLRS